MAFGGGSTVTVVVPVHNAARFIASALNSVLGQSHSPIECLVVDDGSTDETAEVVARYGGRVRYIRTATRGVAAARNAGIAEASGEYVAFLDADDVWLPDKIEKQLAVMKEFPDTALCYCGLTLIDETGTAIGDLGPPEPGDVFRNTLLIEGPSIGVGSTGMVPRTLAISLGGFDERLSTSADADLTCRIAMDHPIRPVREALVLYRQHPGQMHHDPVRTEHDRKLVFQKFFEEGPAPAEVGRLRRRAYANLYLSIANRYRKQSKMIEMTRYLFKAIGQSPLGVVLALRRM